MNTVKTLVMPSKDSEATEQIATQVGAKLRGGEVIELISDLGGGKTTFTRGLARGAGSKDHVSSPTFKISNVYRSPVGAMVHYDFYRLHEPGLMQFELAEAFEDPTNICVVEWGEVVKDVLPANRMTVHIKTVNENARELEFAVPEQLHYLVEGIV